MFFHVLTYTFLDRRHEERYGLNDSKLYSISIFLRFLVNQRTCPQYLQFDMLASYIVIQMSRFQFLVDASYLQVYM
jgi:hypothetical protein